MKLSKYSEKPSENEWSSEAARQNEDNMEGHCAGAKQSRISRRRAKSHAASAAHTNPGRIQDQSNSRSVFLAFLAQINHQASTRERSNIHRRPLAKNSLPFLMDFHGFKTYIPSVRNLFLYKCHKRQDGLETGSYQVIRLATIACSSAILKINSLRYDCMKVVAMTDFHETTSTHCNLSVVDVVDYRLTTSCTNRVTGQWDSSSIAQRMTCFWRAKDRVWYP